SRSVRNQRSVGESSTTRIFMKSGGLGWIVPAWLGRSGVTRAGSGGGCERQRDAGRCACGLRQLGGGGTASTLARRAGIGHASIQVLAHRADQRVLGEGLGQVLVRAHHAAARAVEQAVL